MKLSFILLFLIFGCEEFYDEEFEEFQETRAQNVQEVSYRADLISTDPSLNSLQGTAVIDVRDNQVMVELDIDGVPENIIQIHYGYITASCENLVTTLQTDSSTTRSFEASETTSVDALAQDLASSGAALSEGDINLAGKSFVVKAFSNFSGTPTTTATNQLTIACGELIVEDGGASNTDIFTPPDPTLPFPPDRGDVGSDNPSNF